MQLKATLRAAAASARFSLLTLAARTPGIGTEAVNRGTQVALQLEFQRLVREGGPLPRLDDVEFRNYSQNGEDGILLYLFTVVGMGGRRAVELCAGDGVECNSANLILNHDWDALLVDGDANAIGRGRAFYAGHPDSYRVPPTLESTWVTVDNVNDLLRRHGMAEDVDLLTLDMDGVDYWIAKAIEARPRAWVVEYNCRIPAGESVTVPYDARFAAAGDRTHGQGFFGASLDAFDRLLTDRGYRLVGANRPNTNAFFLRDDVAPDLLPAVPVATCLSSRWARAQSERWWPELKDGDWTQV